MSSPDQTGLPTLNERFRDAYNDYIEARTKVIDLLGKGWPDDAQVWATLAVAAATVMAEPVSHCPNCCH